METIKVHLKETPHAWWARVADGNESHHYSAEHPLDALCKALGLPEFGEYIPALDSDSLDGVTLTFERRRDKWDGAMDYDVLTIAGAETDVPLAMYSDRGRLPVDEGTTQRWLAMMLAELIVDHEMGYDAEGAEWDEDDEECDCDAHYPESCAHAGGNAAGIRIPKSIEVYERCPDCNGSRVYEGLFSRESCRTCNGAGVV